MMTDTVFRSSLLEIPRKPSVRIVSRRFGIPSGIQFSGGWGFPSIGRRPQLFQLGDPSKRVHFHFTSTCQRVHPFHPSLLPFTLTEAPACLSPSEARHRQRDVGPSCMSYSSSLFSFLFSLFPSPYRHIFRHVPDAKVSKSPSKGEQIPIKR